MITAILSNELSNVSFEVHKVFGLKMPVNCPNIPSNILNQKILGKIKKHMIKRQMN